MKIEIEYKSIMTHLSSKTNCHRYTVSRKKSLQTA